MIRSLMICLFFVGRSDCLFIEGCPLLGCRPSGTYSMYLNVPRKNASVVWETKFIYIPVPRALGCVANGFNIICQSNGPFSEDKGYVSLDGGNGTVRWWDKVLRFPSLPVMDNYGDVTGSDGDKLVHYDSDGKLFPIIPCKGMKPMFSMTLLGTNYLLMVSEHGELAVRATNGVPISFLFLNATIEGIEGIFLPVSNPVVNGDRFYIMTYFMPTEVSKQYLVLNRRLYAIDVHQRMSAIITIAWYYSFDTSTVFPERETRSERLNYVRNKDSNTNISEFQTMQSHFSKKFINENVIAKQDLIWDEMSNMIYAILQPVNSSSYGEYLFWAIRDVGNTTSLIFRLDKSVNHMTMFESNTDANNGKQGDETIPNSLWLCLNNGKIVSLSKNGTLIRTINLPAILKADITITSKVVTARASGINYDILIMGIKLSNHTRESISILREYGITDEKVSSLMIALDTSTELYANGLIMWMVAVPGNLEIKGQISGSLGVENQRKDRIVFYAEEPGESAKVMAIE